MFNTSPIEHSPEKPRKLRLQSGQPMFRSLDIDPRARNVEAEVDDVLSPGLAVKCQMDVGGGRRGKTSGIEPVNGTCSFLMHVFIPKLWIFPCLFFSLRCRQSDLWQMVLPSSPRCKRHICHTYESFESLEGLNVKVSQSIKQSQWFGSLLMVWAYSKLLLNEDYDLRFTSSGSFTYSYGTCPI